MIKKYSQLYNKAQRKELSQTERNELNSLVQALLKLDPIKMELFLGLREIKRYIDEDDYYYYEYWNDQRHQKAFSHFFTQLSQRYKSKKEVQKKEIIDEILENWIEETSEEEISLEMKVVLIKILENYNELEELASNFMKLYKKEQLRQISQSEKSKLLSLIKTLGKLSPIKIELFANIRAIKHYLKDQSHDELLNKKCHFRVLNSYLKNISQKYIKLDLNKTETLNTGKIHTKIIKKLKQDLKQENYSKELSISKLSNLVKGLSLTQLKKLKTTTKNLRYATYLEFYYFIKQAYENNKINPEKWKEMEKLFKILFETTTSNTKSLPSQYELKNFFYPSYVEPIWELWNSLEWEKYQNSHALLKRYWGRYCNHIALILIEYSQKFNNIPFKAYVLKEGESKWREIEDRSKIQNMNLSNLEKNLSEQLNIDLEKDIMEIRLLNKKYQYKYILENSIYNAEDFLNELKTLINSFIKKNLVKKHIELQINNKLERVNLIRRTKITQYALSILMEEDKEYVEKVIKQNLRYNEHYIINFACLNHLSININSIFKENEKEIKEISHAVKSVQEIIKYYVERNQRFYLAKNQVIIQNHPNIILNYFNMVFDEKYTIEERLEAVYWLGFIFADGYITINARDKNSPKEFGINLSIKDKSQLVKFCLAIGANPTFIRNVITSEKDGKSYFASIFRIYNEKFCKIMENHGIVRKKSKIIELPEQFKSLKKNNDDLKKIFLSFLLGYYDGDGIANRNTIISGSKMFLNQVNKVLSNAFGANLNTDIVERTEGIYYLNLERNIKQNMENVFQNSLERKRKYTKSKYSENIDPLILKLIIQNLNELPISEMSKIYNDVIEKLNLPKYLKLSANNLKRNIALNGYKIHNKTWYFNRNLNLRLNENVFKKKLREFLEKLN